MAQSNDEIDLLELLAKAVLVAKRNAKTIILALVAGTLLGSTFYLVAQKVYESKMILLSDILTTSYSGRITESLDRLIIEANKKGLAEKLKMSENDAAQIANIKIESVKTEKTPNEKDNEIFIVTVRVVDNAILPELQEKIIAYLRNNEYVRIRVELKKIYTEETIKKIDEELLALGQLKSKIEKGEFVQGNKDKLVVFDPTTVHSKILDLNKERITLQNSLQTINSIQLIEGFTVFEKPVSPKLLRSLSYGAFLGLLLAAVLIGVKIIRKMLIFSEEKLGQS